MKGDYIIYFIHSYSDTYQPNFIVYGRHTTQKNAKKKGYTIKPLNTVCVTILSFKILITTFSNLSGSVNSKISLFSFGNIYVNYYSDFTIFDIAFVTYKLLP